jgi:hypothetical protein
MSKFCLLMIVKDESDIITRAFESLKNIFTSYYIMDTGSTDNTIEVIKDWMEKNDKKGDMCINTWKNFGYNKSLLLKNAYEHINPIISKAENWVWLDADEVYITDLKDPLSYPTIEDSEKLYNLIKNSKNNIFKIYTKFGSLQYVRPNMAKNNQLYKWEQPVHEYFVGVESHKEEFIDFIYNYARKQGNSSKNPDRYKKDAEMFIEFLNENPDEPRATFYLAQTYESFNDEKAIEFYYKRLNIMSGFYQERYISCLRLSKKVKSELEKKNLLIKAIEIDPRRLEAYYHLMMIEYVKNNHHLVISWGLLATNSKKINNDFLFIEYPIYNYLFNLNFGVSCYYTKMYDLGKKVTLEAIESIKNIDPNNKHILDLLNKNIYFFNLKINDENNNLLLKPPRQELIVIDNFYDNPLKIREDAINEEYPVVGNFPGYRTNAILYDGIKEKFESIIGRKITYWPTGNTSYNGSFQYTTSNMKSWIHRDKTEWSAIIFLTPNPPPNSGTLLYKHLPSNQMYAYNSDDEKLMNNDTYDLNKWELVDKIGNLFNRCILFRGKRSHISDTYFGDSITNGRLFQTFFFND